MNTFYRELLELYVRVIADMILVAGGFIEGFKLDSLVV